MANPPTYVEPSFDLKHLKEVLADPNTTEKEKKAIIQGLHYKFWHASAVDLKKMLYRAGYGADVLALVQGVVNSCKECQTWKRKMTMPAIKAAISEHFNHRVQTDLFIFDKTFIILIDECIRYCIVEPLLRKTSEEWMKLVLHCWIRYFGPMRFLVTDQEGALTSDMIGKCCEKFNIHREFGGSQGHTSAPLAERRIEIIRLSSQKVWATVQKTGLNATQEECVVEAAMSSNLMLTYGGFTPTTALLGYFPSDLYDPENAGIASATGILETPADAMEVALRLRLLAEDAILQSVVEDRIARAHNTKIQQHRPEDRAKLVDGAKVDLWREPDAKDDPGWRGPAELIKAYPDGAKAVVNWRGHIMLVPLRHLRPHVGFVWLAHRSSTPSSRATPIYSAMTGVVSELMDLVESTGAYQVIVQGLVYLAGENTYVCLEAT